jgi:hypothetical protein
MEFKSVLPDGLQPNRAVTELQHEVQGFSTTDDVSSIQDNNDVVLQLENLPLPMPDNLPLYPKPKLDTVSSEHEVKPISASLKFGFPSEQPMFILKKPNPIDLVEEFKELYRWNKNKWRPDVNPYSPEETEIIRKTALLIADTCHISLPGDEVLVLTTDNFPTIVSVIKKLVGKVGLGELGAMVLLAIAVNDSYGLKKMGYKSESDFFNYNSASMGISASTARDYSIRGRIFLDYRLDILNGIEEIEGISLETFANTCMAKLTLFEKAVDTFGRKQALIYLKTLSFREFKNKISLEIPKNSLSKDKKHLQGSKRSDCEYNQRLQELDLKPNEKRLLKLKVKKAKYVCFPCILTEYQASLIDSLYREHRLNVIRQRYNEDYQGWANFKPADPGNPLKVDDLSFFNGGVYQKVVSSRDDYSEKVSWGPDEPMPRFDNRIFDLDDIILRIRAGIAQMQPERRTIAILLFKLVNVKTLKNKWKNPREGVKYESFRDFAIEELGLGENYRDYLAVGKVLMEYNYFLDHLSDIDTEETFLKLRHIPAALKNHKNDEHLVLARLRSLTIREFKRFSTDPDFEITFGRRLTNKEWEEFVNSLCNTRDPRGFGFDTNIDFIEVFSISHQGIVLRIAEKVIEETSLTIIHPAQMIDTTLASKQVDKITDDVVHANLDDANQSFPVSVA